MAVPAGPPPVAWQLPDGALDRGPVRVSHPATRRDCPSLGEAEEQATDELRQAQSRPSLLLRQGHYGQSAREEAHLPIHLRCGGVRAVQEQKSQCSRGAKVVDQAEQCLCSTASLADWMHSPLWPAYLLSI